MAGSSGKDKNDGDFSFVYAEEQMRLRKDLKTRYKIVAVLVFVGLPASWHLAAATENDAINRWLVRQVTDRLDVLNPFLEHSTLEAVGDTQQGTQSASQLTNNRKSTKSTTPTPNGNQYPTIVVSETASGIRSNSIR